MPATYSPGGGMLIGHGTRWLLLAHAPAPALVTGLWPRVQDGTPPAALADLAQRLSGGAACAVIDTGTREQVVRGISAAEEGDTVTLSLEASPGRATLPLQGGVVAAGMLHLTGLASGVRRPPAAPTLIDGVPDTIRAAAPPVDAPTIPPRPAAASPDVEYGATRVRPATPRAGGDPLQQHTGETVLAVRCPRHHLTPLENAVCRQCGAPVAPQEPLRVPRPPLGRLLLADGQEVLLDRGAVLGRRPEPVPGGEMWPHLVELPPDNTSLSRSHLLVQLEGWRILARDLGSLGGSVIRAPGAPPMRMRPHESYLLEPGSVVDLSDGFPVRCVVELSGDPA